MASSPESNKARDREVVSHLRKASAARAGAGLTVAAITVEHMGKFIHPENLHSSIGLHTLVAASFALYSEHKAAKQMTQAHLLSNPTETL